MLYFVLLLIAVILFAVAAFVNHPRINLMCLALAAFAGAFLAQAGSHLS